ncbi:Protein of unknown function [Hymenobacter daecheongensis DSM 21074]|uniref:DUF2851 domain-containing protein n=1 Tax=Hymenobacter daecheongensis DSM 21074 TaxID=1121955 RepID=A0A1M6E4A7_9BACT|nr:DUF2851 family protein [Hymenobacter daecheongensis]SHI80210.1 Protein of unknown function [Hymenobacter daecheongensis DSM 21074]
MKEDFLHYVWQHQYFDKTTLQTAAGEPITVLRPGYRNADAGPDFLNARLQLGEVEWNGAVEIHLRASDWHRHQHQTDAKYDQVVLHVVYTADQDVRRTNGSLIPVLPLAPRIAPDMLTTYQRLMDQPAPVALPCAPLLPLVPEITRLMMVERTLLERVEQKAAVLEALHHTLGGDWEATAYHALAAGFGFQKNTEPLARLAKALPQSTVRRHRHDLRQLEALVFGQAGFLTENAETPDDAYIGGLREEYAFLRHKYTLPGALPVHEWNFLRLRPANFPPVRLAQLAALLHARPALFDALLSASSVAVLEEFFQAPVSDYWRQHYRPGKPGKVPALGRSSVHLLVTNVVVPLRVAYARHVGQPELVEAAVALLEQLPAEHNHLTAPYELLGFRHRSAADSQGLLALSRGYCQPRRCLHCAIGSRILQPNGARL